MRISESVVIVFFLPMFCSFIDLPQLQCVLSNEQFQINDTLFKKVEEREMNLARELCAQGSLSSFCDDGNDQPYRSYPAFVHLNFENFMCSYDSIVYLFATPSIWDIETDRGPTRIRLKGEEDIRRIAGNTLLIADSNGMQFLIKDATQLDKVSKKLLDRFR